MQRLIRRNASATLQKVIKKLHPADIALLLDHLRSSEVKVVFSTLENTEIAAEVLSEISYSTAAELLETLKPAIIAEILTEMASDDAAEIIADMPDELTDEVLKLMEDKNSDLVEELLSYTEETAGRIMTPEFLALKGDLRVEDAIREVQKASDAEMVFYVYVVDQEQHLMGVISLRQLVTGSPDKLLKEIMISDVIRVRTDQDQEEVARLVARYNLLAIPVVTERNKLVGIITVDDILDVISDEATEDIMRMSGTSQQDIEASNAIQASRIRFPWILTNLIGGIGAFLIISRYTNLFQQLSALIGFIPLILGIGGNVANQSSTSVTQGLLSGVISPHRIGWVIFRELRIGLILGFSYGLLTGFITFFLTSMDIGCGIAIGVALSVVIIVSTMLGSFFPILFQRINIDPAIASGPIIISIIDFIAITLYVAISALILP
ncbi:magnesium transporter [candidate division CSSED10-310 bacterium]|uniref:Magnesium transporter MgtE n=1 Tax=candidate division CSSED10-310 bacterium TaxID=2855610 RepID=A0ABV6YZQ8_UNCC1